MKDTKCFVVCYPNSKIPVGEKWDAHPLSMAEIDQRRTNNPAINVGLLLGPVSGLIDVECDGEEATAAYAKLLGSNLTPSWQSTRGRHHLYQYDERLAGLANAVHYEGLEFRLGNGKATQSICPPSVVDGVCREWVVSFDQCQPVGLPEPILQALLTLPPAAKRTRKSQMAIPGIWKTKVDKLLSYCRRVGLSVAEVREDPEWGVFIDLFPCPFKGAGHEDGGNPAIIVHHDGGHSFHCFHSKCVDKKWADIEKVFGPLYPTIKVNTDLHRAVAQSIQALGEDSNTYQRGTLVEVAHDAPKPKLCLNDNGSPKLRPIQSATLMTRLSSCAKYKRWNATKNSYVGCLPPENVVNAVLFNVQYPGIPVVMGVVSSPILRSDGTIAAEPGYDKLTGLYLDTAGPYPDLMEPHYAVELLQDVLVDFPFASPAHQSGCYAALVSLLARAAFAGPAPFFLFDANASRVGKGLLTDVITVITEGRRASRYSPPRDNEEMRKAITSAAISGVPYLLFDNIKGKFGGATLENAMTACRWSDRILGGNRQVDLPLTLVWLGTSNNATLTQDMIGRTCHIRLNTDCERPDLRSGFKHHDLIEHVKDHRRELVIAALSIPAGYIQAGRPEVELPAWGGFENWSDLVRKSLVWAGLPDPDTRDTLAEQADEETVVLRQLMDGWEELEVPCTVNRAIEVVDEGGAPLLKLLLGEFQGHRNHVLGNLLRDHRARVLDGRKLERTSSKTPRWHLVPITGESAT